MWTIDKDFHAQNAVKVFEHQGVPVLIKLGGYPNATRDDGVKLRDVPHVTVNILEGSLNGVRYPASFYVSAVSGRMRLHLIGTMDVGDKTVEALIEEGMSRLDDAVDLLHRMPSIYREAETRMSQGHPYASKDLTRGEYEEATRELSVACWPDSDMTSYELKYGDFRYPDNTADYCLEITLARARRRGWLKEQAKPKAVQIERKVRPWGQAGVRYDESCEACGKVGVIDNDTALCNKCSTLQGKENVPSSVERRLRP